MFRPSMDAHRVYSAPQRLLWSKDGAGDCHPIGYSWFQVSSAYHQIIPGRNARRHDHYHHHHYHHRRIITVKGRRQMPPQGDKETRDTRALLTFGRADETRQKLPLGSQLQHHGQCRQHTSRCKRRRETAPSLPRVGTFPALSALSAALSFPFESRVSSYPSHTSMLSF